ncbi:hypothetical protein [Candidatus Tisiphia endosymbiont of Sialis lutaria]
MQFTSNDFIKELSSRDIKISMDHKGIVNSGEVGDVVTSRRLPTITN